MSVKKFQEGGFIDEAELFSDDEGSEGAEGLQEKSPLTGELEGEGDGAGDQGGEGEGAQGGEGVGEGADGGEGDGEGGGSSSDLTGVELFLSDYGIQGGMIEYEDGESVHFDTLAASEQEEVLKSLTTNATPSIEEKFNLDGDEITLINAFRESGVNDMGEFLNNIVDERLTKHLQTNQEMSINYDAIEKDDLFIYHLKEKHEDFSDEQIADELVKAKELVTYEDTVDAIRNSYKHVQAAKVAKAKKEELNEFSEEVESQRHEIVKAIEDINDIAGAQINDDVKEYLLTDIMEMNDNNDPVLMEKIFSTPENMFKANWFLTYGEDYMNNLNEYWKKQVSSAYKKGYEKSINGMPANPTIIGADMNKKNSPSRNMPQPRFGETVTEEELFD